jgi:hypothetical protein
VGRIFVVGAPEVLDYAAGWPEVTGVAEGKTLVDNAWKGLQTAQSDWVLFCNPDQPLLREPMVTDFVDGAVGVGDADLVSSWVRHEDLGKYTEGEHKFACFGDGKFAHGNLFLVRRRFPDARRARRRMDALYSARKSNLKFAWALGLPLFLRFLMARITGCLPTLHDTLALAGRHFGVRFLPVICPYPEIVLDIDEPEDYAAAERHLADAECGTRNGECAVASASPK